ncbi:MAG: hypothetical protein RIQ60_1722 [Pseudomonadota bacterium]|jgi:predicted component of type VI protein secretion system
MTLTLSALSLNGLPLSQPFVAHFDGNGGSIGRGEHNTLMLPDPERHISRQHARISADGNGYRITNLSATNVVTVGTRSLAGGESAQILHRDQLRIGGFLLEASFSGGVASDSTTANQARTITQGRAALGGGRGPVFAATAATQDELWQAFRMGAGLAPGTPKSLTPDTMCTLGELLRAAVDGTAKLLAAQTPGRHGPDAPASLSLRGNLNPLYSLIDGQDPLPRLLSLPPPGGSTGAGALSTALHDLLTRSLAQPACMMTALDATLTRLAPGALIACLEASNLTYPSSPFNPQTPELETQNDACLSMVRRARLWDMYCQQYDQLRLEAQHHFGAVYDHACTDGVERQFDLCDLGGSAMNMAPQRASCAVEQQAPN